MTPAITRLTLTNFRNYPSLRLEVDSPLLALTGPNGAGKTNLLEAISLFTPGRGLRGAALEELAYQRSPGNWAAATELATTSGTVTFGTAWTNQSEGETSRQVVINGRAERSSGAFAQHLRLLWLTPAMDRLFSGPASDRRRFLDRLVSGLDPEHAARIQVFEKVMRDRNLVLEDARVDRQWLSSLEAHMAEAAVAIAAARALAVESLQHHIHEARNSSPFPWGELRIEGELENLVTATPAVRVEDEYRKILADSRRLDRAAGRTLRGPHRSDLVVLHGPKSMAAGLSSTGEQKALLIGLILAQARAVKGNAGMAPVLLLDEVAAHLDRERRKALFSALVELGCQTWMTGTEAGLFEDMGKRAALLQVEGGRIWQDLGT